MPSLIGTSTRHLRNARMTPDRSCRRGVSAQRLRGFMYCGFCSPSYRHYSLTIVQAFPSTSFCYSKPHIHHTILARDMPSPFHQKYSSQSHKVFGDNTVPAMPEVPKDDAQRRGSDASMTEPSSPSARRRVSRHQYVSYVEELLADISQSSAAQRFGNLEMLKRPSDPASTERRSSLQDAYGKSGFLGTMWNK